MNTSEKKLADALRYIATIRDSGADFADDNTALDAIIAHASAALAEYDATANDPATLSECEALKRIIRSHEAQIVRMGAERDKIAKAAKELLDSQGGTWERGNAYISVRGAERMNAAMRRTRAILMELEGH